MQGEKFPYPFGGVGSERRALDAQDFDAVGFFQIRIAALTACPAAVAVSRWRSPSKFAGASSVARAAPDSHGSTRNLHESLRQAR
jgi:hypothetical protein